jgi:hypothetical protein
VGFDVLTTCQPSTVWCSRERLPAAAAQPDKVRQSCSATDFILLFIILNNYLHIDHSEGVGGKMGSEWILERMIWGGGC